MNLNWLITTIGCMVLLALLYRYRKAGARVFWLAILGCLVIVGATLCVQSPAQFVHLIAVVLVVVLFAAILALVSLVIHVRRQSAAPGK